MPYWYPKQSRVNALTAQLLRLEKVAAKADDDVAERMSFLSEQLRNAQGRRDFPVGQIPRWLWLSAQYRIHSDSGSPAYGKTAAALHFLSEVLEREELTEEDHQDLNWVLDAAVGALAPLLGPADLRGCLSAAELERIDQRLAAHDDSANYDPESVAVAIQGQLATLRSFAGVGALINLEAKVTALAAAAERPGPENEPARAALRYFAVEDDVLDDRTGVLGLIDDLYVIEWAYAAVESQTRCLPLLDAMIRRWPFVASAGLAARGEPLDRYGQYVACAALYTLFDPAAGALIVRDVGAFAIIGAVAACLEAARGQTQRFDEEIELWEIGTPVTISDGTTAFQACFGGTQLLGDRMRYRLHVDERGTILVGDEVLPYLSKAVKSYKRLSRGQQISLWLKDRHVDSLMHLTGGGRRRPQRYEAVLLVGPRWKLDSFLPLMSPLGSTPVALLGARWIDGHGVPHELPGSATDRPLLYACADPGMACELIADPPAHVASWRVVVDGASAGATLYSALATSDRLDRASLCIFAGLHEREATTELSRQGVENLWLLEDQDVTVPPSAHPGSRIEDNALARFLGRQSDYWTTEQMVHSGNDAFLEAVSDCLLDRVGPDREDPALQALDLAIATFLRRAIGLPLIDDDPESDDLERLARTIVGQAGILAVYDDGARRLRELFGRFLAEGAKLADRSGQLAKIANEAHSRETVAVVCRSLSVADRCRSRTHHDALLGRFNWMTVEGLRRSAPFDRVVVPGWLGRHTMREIAANGYGAKTDLIFLPFERRWFDATVAAARKWERRLEKDTIRRLTSMIDAGLTNRTGRWNEQTQRRLEPRGVVAEFEPTADLPEIERIEAHAVEVLMRALPGASTSEPNAKAQLVLFAEPGSYALLPPHGQVILLETNAGKTSAATRSGVAERQLFVNVADLKQGMLLALPEGADRDLIDARADQLLADGGATRTAAALWKTSLKRHLERGRSDARSFSRRMAEAGEPRDALTIRSWAGDTRSVAPRNYRWVVPLIAELTGDEELAANMTETIAAIDRIYRARTQAAERILAEIFSGALDLSRARLDVEVEGRRLSFGLHRVDRCAGIREVPVELIGRAAQFSDLQSVDVDTA